MGYYSFCTGFVKPAGSLEELIEALKEKGFEVDEDGLINSPYGDYTGFEVDEEKQELKGHDESLKLYSGFEDFVAALQELSPLIARASLTREGEEHDDTEGYEFDGSRWYVAVYPVVLVPVNRAIEASKRLEQVATELRYL